MHNEKKKKRKKKVLGKPNVKKKKYVAANFLTEAAFPSRKNSRYVNPLKDPIIIEI